MNLLDNPQARFVFKLVRVGTYRVPSMVLGPESAPCPSLSFLISRTSVNSRQREDPVWLLLSTDLGNVMPLTGESRLSAQDPVVGSREGN